MSTFRTGTELQRYYCRRCNVEISGASELCVMCFNDLLTACSACMRARGRHGECCPITKNGSPVDCPVCRNERYVLRDYTPGEITRKGY